MSASSSGPVEYKRQLLNATHIAETSRTDKQQVHLACIPHCPTPPQTADNVDIGSL